MKNFFAKLHVFLYGKETLEDRAERHERERLVYNWSWQATYVICFATVLIFIVTRSIIVAAHIAGYGFLIGLILIILGNSVYKTVQYKTRSKYRGG